MKTKTALKQELQPERPEARFCGLVARKPNPARPLPLERALGV